MERRVKRKEGRKKRAEDARRPEREKAALLTSRKQGKMGVVFIGYRKGVI